MTDAFVGRSSRDGDERRERGAVAGGLDGVVYARPAMTPSTAGDPLIAWYATITKQNG